MILTIVELSALAFFAFGGLCIVLALMGKLENWSQS